MDLDDETPELDLSQISDECTAQRFDWDPVKGSDESRSSHSLRFVFILWYFYEYISIKIVYFHLIYYVLFIFFIVKVVVASSQQDKCSISLPHDITINTPVSTMLSLIPNNNVTKSLDLIQNIQVVEKMGMLPQKPDLDSNHIINIIITILTIFYCYK